MSYAHKLAEAANEISKPATVTQIEEAVIKEDDEQEEINMAITQLKSLIEKSNEALGMLKQGMELEAWVQSKITMADDYITTIRDYLKHAPKE